MTSATLGDMPERMLTYADLLDFPDDGLRREILNGELLVSPSPRTKHQSVELELAYALLTHVKAQGGGRVFVAPFDVLLAEHDVVEPDVIFVASDQLDIITDKHIVGVPALLIEVVSASRVDRVRKRDRYEAAGVAEYWIAEPDADRIEVYRLRDGRYGKLEIFEPGDVLTFERLPGFELDVRALFTP